MNKKNQFFSNLLFFFFTLLLPFKAEASDLLNDYVPRNPQREIDQRRTSGSGLGYGCGNIFPRKSLTLLVPEEEVVYYTTKDNPSFYLYAQAASTVPLKFNLVIPEPNVNNPIAEKTLVIEQPGLHEIKLPADVKLETDRIYFWQIGIPCKDNPQKMAQVLRAAVKRIPVSVQLTERLKSTDMFLKKAKFYAEEGIWYDALDLSFPLYQYNSSSLSQLLKSMGVEQEPIIPDSSSSTHNPRACGGYFSP